MSETFKYPPKNFEEFGQSCSQGLSSTVLTCELPVPGDGKKRDWYCWNLVWFGSETGLERSQGLMNSFPNMEDGFDFHQSHACTKLTNEIRSFLSYSLNRCTLSLHAMFL